MLHAFDRVLHRVACILLLAVVLHIVDDILRAAVYQRARCRIFRIRFVQLVAYILVCRSRDSAFRDRNLRRVVVHPCCAGHRQRVSCLLHAFDRVLHRVARRLRLACVNFRGDLDAVVSCMVHRHTARFKSRRQRVARQGRSVYRYSCNFVTAVRRKVNGRGCLCIVAVTSARIDYGICIRDRRQGIGAQLPGRRELQVPARALLDDYLFISAYVRAVGGGRRRPAKEFIACFAGVRQRNIIAVDGVARGVVFRARRALQAMICNGKACVHQRERNNIFPARSQRHALAAICLRQFNAVRLQQAVQHVFIRRYGKGLRLRRNGGGGMQRCAVVNVLHRILHIGQRGVNECNHILGRRWLERKALGKRVHRVPGILARRSNGFFQHRAAHDAVACHRRCNIMHRAVRVRIDVTDGIGRVPICFPLCVNRSIRNDRSVHVKRRGSGLVRVPALERIALALGRGDLRRLALFHGNGAILCAVVVNQRYRLFRRGPLGVKH